MPHTSTSQRVITNAIVDAMVASTGARQDMSKLPIYVNALKTAAHAARTQRDVAMHIQDALHWATQAETAEVLDRDRVLITSRDFLGRALTAAGVDWEGEKA